jgi:hypothetical protein
MVNKLIECQFVIGKCQLNSNLQLTEVELSLMSMQFALMEKKG